MEVVGDEEDGHSHLPVQPLQQGQYLGLNGDIQRRGGLVRQQQTGPGHNGGGDHHPLEHSAGELVGHGIGLAMISYTIIKVFSGKAKDVSVLTYVIAALFIVKFFAVV